MTTADDGLLALAERLEQEPFQTLSRDLLLEIFRTARPRTSFATGRDCDDARHVFVSLWEACGWLDAALMLLPEEWKLRQMNFSAPCADDRKWHLNLHGGSVGQDTFVGRGYWPALALCAASLRARYGGRGRGQ